MQLVQTKGQPKLRRKARVEAIAVLIAEQVQEKEAQPVRQIRRVVSVLGVRQAIEYPYKTQRIEASGGMMFTDGSRRRSAGGAFFLSSNILTDPPDKGSRQVGDLLV